MLGLAIDDPWYRYITDGSCTLPWVVQPGGTNQQPYPPGTTAQDKSNKIQQFGGVGCPEFEYDTWKQIAQSGGSDVHYYAWDNGTEFRENGVGAPADWTVLTDAKQGLFFFDTMDGLAPHSPDANGVCANLTPDMQVSANYGIQGFLYVNTRMWTATGSAGRPATMHWPGEPYRDANENGLYDTGEDWVNLNYATISTTDQTAKPVVSAANDPAGDKWVPPGVTAPTNSVYNSRGPDFTATKDVVVWGLTYISGDFDAQGTPLFFGSVVTKSGSHGKMAGTPDIYWDTDLKDNWPPPGWELPRVIITKWETDL